MRSLLEAVSYLREYDKLANISEIARRYFAMNAFDEGLRLEFEVAGHVGRDTAAADEAVGGLGHTVPVLPIKSALSIYSGCCSSPSCWIGAHPTQA